MTESSEQVGFSQRVRLEWLELAAVHAMAGSNAEEITGVIREVLREKVSVGRDAERGNREKVITIVRRTWFSNEDKHHDLRERGLSLLRGLPKERRVIVHWGMVMAVYPFWNAVADAVGRLLRLQGSLEIAQVQRRLRERYGERETVARSARRIIRSFVDWSVLAEGEKSGTYQPSAVIDIDRVDMIAWLVEASLRCMPDKRLALSAITTSPGLFPFKVAPISCEQLLARAPKIDVIRHGLDQDLLMLKR